MPSLDCHLVQPAQSTLRALNRNKYNAAQYLDKYTIYIYRYIYIYSYIKLNLDIIDIKQVRYALPLIQTKQVVAVLEWRFQTLEMGIQILVICV